MHSTEKPWKVNPPEHVPYGECVPDRPSYPPLSHVSSRYEVDDGGSFFDFMMVSYALLLPVAAKVSTILLLCPSLVDGDQVPVCVLKLA